MCFLGERIKLVKYPVLRRRALGVFSKWIRSRDRFICFTCGKPGNHAGHFVHINALDFDEININCQCCYCNTYNHGNLGEYAIRLINKYGQDKVNELSGRKHEIRRFTRDELEGIIERYKDD